MLLPLHCRLRLLPPAASPSQQGRDFFDHANIGFDSLSDEDDDRPVAELFSAWRARSGAIQAGNQDEAPRELDRIGAVSHIGEEPSPAQMAHSPLSPITAPLDPDLEAEMKQRGRGHVLLGPSYLQ